MRYRPLLSIAALGALLATHAVADVEITSALVQAGKTTQHTLSLTADKAKIDTDRATIIIDGNTGQITNLLKGRNTYMTFNAKEMGARMSGAMAMMKDKLKAMPEAQRRQIEAMMAKHGGMPGSAEGQPTKIAFESTGTSETVGAWSCRDFHEKKNGVLFADVCIAPVDTVGLTPDDQAAFRALSSTMTKSMPTPLRDASATDFDDMTKQIGFAGMPVKTVIYADGTPQITTTVTSIAHTPLTPDAFAVPAGYTRMSMPGFGGGRE